ncbi:hypothetical protein BJ875DRAFT_233033 [Amylocarpus encephaloides]|uniref:Uncharacterized protein n=1 Tax=Amylocarpus encephaloides TaxID=45428 RepID=A0A9P7YNB3_9HELO|nr:hypothetical protein BJ875DRAFT_233033 [Amylocarpus encephaloides]
MHQVPFTTQTLPSVLYPLLLQQPPLLALQPRPHIGYLDPSDRLPRPRIRRRRPQRGAQPLAIPRDTLRVKRRARPRHTSIIVSQLRVGHDTDGLDGVELVPCSALRFAARTGLGDLGGGTADDAGGC